MQVGYEMFSTFGEVEYCLKIYDFGACSAYSAKILRQQLKHSRVGLSFRHGQDMVYDIAANIHNNYDILPLCPKFSPVPISVIFAFLISDDIEVAPVPGILRIGFRQLLLCL